MGSKVYFRVFRVLAAAAVLGACRPAPGPAEERRGALGGTLVQQAYSCPQSSQTQLSVALPAAQAAGDLLAVVVGWNDATRTVSSVTDSRGDSFALAVGPTRRTTLLSQSIYLAKNVAAGANSVTVRWSGAAAFPDVRVAEYAGLDRASPLDVASAASGSSGTASAPAATTHQAGELLVSAGTTTGGFSSSPGAGWTLRVITQPDTDSLQDRQVSAAGSYGATEPLLGSSAWVFQMVALRVAAGTGGSGGAGGGTGGSGSGGAGGAAGSQDASGDVAGGPQDAAGEAFDAAAGGAPGTGGSGPGGSGGTPDASADLGAGGTGGAAGAGGGSLLWRRGPTDRYLVDGSGSPVLVLGSSPQPLPVNLSPASMAAYFAFRAAQGFNASWVNLLDGPPTGGRSNETTYDGLRPFDLLPDTNYDLTKPHPDYWARVDAVFSAARSAGIVLFADPLETIWFETLAPVPSANGAARCRAYGQFLGARYLGYDNVVWMQGNDFQDWSTSPTNESLVREIAAGIADVDQRHLQTVELNYDNSKSSDDALWAPLLGVDAVYTYWPTYAETLASYDMPSPRPAVHIEGNYEGEQLAGAPHVTGAVDVREQVYWSVLSGSTGAFYGVAWEVHALDDGWPSRPVDPGAVSVGRARALFSPLRWWTLVPDQGHSLMTAGAGSCPSGGNAQSSQCAVAARSPDGALGVVYMPSRRPASLAMGQMAGPTSARWYDPAAGTYQDAPGSPLPNSGTAVLSPPAGAHADGSDDWVLLLEASP